MLRKVPVVWIDCFNPFSTLYWQTFEKGLEQIFGELVDPTQTIRGHNGPLAKESVLSHGQDLTEKGGIFGAKMVYNIARGTTDPGY